MKAMTFGDLSPAKQEITRRMQQMGFGKICDLKVAGGEPILENVSALKRRKLAKPQLPIQFSDVFQLKTEHLEFFQTLDEIQNGVIALVDIRNGLPCEIDIVEKI